MEAHPAADDIAGDAGDACRSGSGRREDRKPVFFLWQRAGFRGPVPDGAARRHYRRDWAGRLRQIDPRAGVPLRSALWRLGQVRREGAFRPYAASDRRDRRLSGPRPGAERRNGGEQCPLRQQSGRDAVSGRRRAEGRGAWHGEWAGYRDRQRRHAPFRRSGAAAGAGKNACASKAASDPRRSLLRTGPQYRGYRLCESAGLRAG